MKLIEIDDNNISSHTNNNRCIDDEEYSKPHILPTLDNIMNDILRRTNISDAEKWYLYSQALQRYLNHLKISSKKKVGNNDEIKSIHDNSTYPGKNNNTSFQTLEDTLNFSLANHFDMSGVEPIRDSLDSISQPTVRNFFERARNVNNCSNMSSISASGEDILMPQKRRAKKKKGKSHTLAYHTRSKTNKRRAENSLSADISQIRPCKVLLNNLNWDTTNAR